MILFAVILHPFFTYIIPSVNYRIALISFASSLYFFLFTIILVKDIQYGMARVNKILTGTLVVISLFCLFRGIFFLIPENTINDYMNMAVLKENVFAGTVHGISLLVAIIVSIFFVVGVMQLNSQMLESELYREQEELKELKERYEHLADNLRDRMIFFSHTLDGKLLYVSQGFALLGSCSPKEAVGMGWKDVVDWSADSLSSGIRHTQKILADTVYNTPLEMSYTHTDGTQHYLLIYEFPVYSHESGGTIIEGVAIDTTHQKRKEEQMQILTEAVENTSASVVITDIFGSISYANPSFTRATGYTKDEAIGQNPRILKSGLHDDVFYQQMWKTLESGTTWRGEMSNKKKDGSIFWELASISPIQDEQGNTINYVAVKDDITEKKELERLKADVDRIMRHDLKSPLNAIIGFPQILEMNGELSDNQIKIVKMIENAGKKMLEMIDNSLDMFKMESGTYNYEPKQIDVLPVILRIILQSQSRLAGKDLKYGILINGTSFSHNDTTPLQNDKFIVLAEEHLLYSLLSNLFINAVEASPENEAITIGLINLESSINLISIHNKGSVPEPVRESFFEKYATYGKSSGTGLGTYSAKLLADAMHYSITMETGYFYTTPKKVYFENHVYNFPLVELSITSRIISCMSITS